MLKNIHLQTVDSDINENQENRFYSCEGTLLKVNNISKIDLMDPNVFKLLSKYDIDEYIFLVINETKINFNI